MTTAAAIVLRDRTNGDPHQVLVAAIDELVAAGVWRVTRRRRRLRRAIALVATGPEPPALAEPLRTADALLRRAEVALGAPVAAADAGRWAALHDAGTVTALVRRTIEDLVARGLLERCGTRLTPTRAGADRLSSAPPPAALRPLTRDAQARAAALRALSPLGRAFLEGWAAAPKGAHGFPPGAVGAGIDPAGPGNGSNTDAAIRTGTATGR